MIDFLSNYKRSQKFCDELRDCAGRKIEQGDTVAYAVSLGRSPGMQIATVHGFTDKGKIQLQVWPEFRKSYGEREIVTVTYSDRMAILDLKRKF